MRNKSTLVLNADFTCLSIITTKKAIKRYIKGLYGLLDGVSVVEFYKNDEILTTMGVKYPVPAVVHRIAYKKVKKDSVSFSRKNVFIRDKLTCQYCGDVKKPEDLEFEHVIPRRIWRDKGYSGTPTCFTNIVAACTSCNRLKADRTPSQAGMKLLKEPMQPNATEYIKGLTPWSTIPPEWLLYLPPLYKDLCKQNANIYI